MRGKEHYRRRETPTTLLQSSKDELGLNNMCTAVGVLQPSLQYSVNKQFLSSVEHNECVTPWRNILKVLVEKAEVFQVAIKEKFYAHVTKVAL